jgi:(2Fe-2S) ferredoxin
MTTELLERRAEPVTAAAFATYPELLTWLLDSDSPQDQAVRQQRQDRVAELRRDRLVRPAIFVGAGTCGLGAGAQETLDAVRAYLDLHEIKADVIKVGCIGMCSAEPLVDIQIPGRTRVMFQQVTKDKVDGLLDAVLAARSRTNWHWPSTATPRCSRGTMCRFWTSIRSSRPRRVGYWPTVV